MIDEKWSVVARRAWRMFLGAAVLMTAEIVLIVSMMPPRVAPYLVGFEVATIVWALREVIVLTSGMMPRRLGILGEEWTVQALRPLRRRGWVLVNHVMMEKADVDHALLGPGGFFGIETKFRSDWSCGVKDAREIAAFAKKSARKLESRLGLRVLEPRVTPVVVMWGPGLADVATPAEQDVVFLAGDDVAAYFEALPSTIISSELLERCTDSLDRYVRIRDEGERLQQGPPPRSAEQRALDVPIVLGVALLTLLGLIHFAHLPPLGWWTVGGAALFSGLAWLVRPRLPRRPRVRYLTTALITTALGVGVPIGVVAATVGWR